ncbi:MAG: arylsulfatase [Verrucomicrobia bacterium]|nr:arylsulfatase [Verrucomicrobiota bacterium]MDA7511535.1 arylsulfatase [Verrucomicrobiota bacterium]MDA7667574.1 arylsulfatase [bacterium]
MKYVFELPESSRYRTWRPIECRVVSQFALTVFLVLLLALHPASFAHAAPPNIVFIMADDLGYGDLGCYGQTRFRTPNIDALAKRGVRFTQAYAGGPVCNPSRSVLMTGRHGGHTAARDNVPHYGSYLEANDITLAEVLKEAGYRTGGIGKWSLGDTGTEGDATAQGFDMWFGYQNQDHAHYYFPEYLDDSAAPDGRVEYPGNSISREIYSHDVMTDRALEFIAASTRQPFFLYAAYTVPHFSHSSEDEDRLSVPNFGPYADKKWSSAAKKYGSMVHRLDRDVGRIVNRIESLGITDKTLIVVTSDQGPLGTGLLQELDNNGPLRGSKRTLYEGGIRIPFIACWEGVLPNDLVSDEIITFWDMLPTLAEIACVQAPSGMDGFSVWNAFLGRPLEKAHDYLYWDYGHTRKRYDQAVRVGDWKGIRHGVGGMIQLFNLASDLGETKDLSREHPDVVRQIETIMRTAVIPSARYEVGTLYQGKPIWQREDHW